MQIEINTSHDIEGRESLIVYVRSVVNEALRHHASHVTRVEVHLSDENAAKTAANNKRCLMEARLEGREPAAVTHLATNVHDAVTGAAHRLARQIEHTLGKQQDERRHRSDPVLPGQFL